MKLASIGECMVEATLDRAGAFAGPAQMSFGGDTLNTAVYARRCLVAPEAAVSYVTALGDDVFSESMTSAWQAEGLDTTLVYRLPGGRPGLYAISTDSAGERRFFYWRQEAAARALLDDGRDRRLREALSTYDLVYLSGITLAILGESGRATLFALLRVLRGAGVRIAFDGNHRPILWPDSETAKAAYAEIGALTDIALPTLDDEALLHGPCTARETAQRWLGFGASEVAVKCGAQGCEVFTRDSHQPIPGHAVAEVIDTTAAGDSFNGAYLAHRLRGQGPEQAAAEGCGLAARVIQHKGAIMPA